MNGSRLTSSFRQYRVLELVELFRNGRLNLTPAFQRKSVWSIGDRRRLIQSIVNNYPVPSLFFHYRLNDKQQWVEDVLDGKQRLETLLMFMREGTYRRDRFSVSLDLGDGEERYDWSTIRRRFPQVQRQIEEYELPVIRVDSIDFGQIRDLFVRINSTGKRLTSGEIRNAKFYDSPFLKTAGALARRSQTYLLDEEILSPKELARMKGTELFAELLMSIYRGKILNKKKALDDAIGKEAIPARELAKAAADCMATLNVLKKILPGIGETRFHKIADFYSLFMVIWDLRKHGSVLGDSDRNAMAARLLRKFSTGVDTLSDKLRKAERIGEEADVYKEYLLSVREGTDSAVNREKRARILHGILGSVFESKDSKRLFTAVQRRILWNTEESRLCASCEVPLTWNNVTIDHRSAHARGGKTSLENAQLMCGRCNSRKGAGSSRPRSRRRAA